jgi:hypothetical protein
MGMAKRNGEDIIKAAYSRQQAECLRAVGDRLRPHDKNRVTLLNMGDHFDSLANEAQDNLSASRLRHLKSVSLKSISASLFGLVSGAARAVSSSGDDTSAPRL